MPAVKDVGEPCAGEPHARFEVAGAGNGTSWPRAAPRVPGKMRGWNPDPSGHRSRHRASVRPYTGSTGRLHHIAVAVDTREEILRAADIYLDNGVYIETGPHKHAIQQTFFLYSYEPAGNRVELCNAGARLLLAPDAPLITWTEAERAKGQAWGLKTIESFHTHGTPPVDPEAS